MKINLNSIGFSELKWIRMTENLNGFGIAASAIGLSAICIARYLNAHSVEWNAAGNASHIETIAKIHDYFHEAP